MISIQSEELYIKGCFKSKLVIHRDKRGHFYESAKISESIFNDHNFVQDNISFSTSNVLRGMHYTIEKKQSQLVTAAYGKVLDVLVDLRQESPTFGKYDSVLLGPDEEYQRVFMPHGIAHGFQVISDESILHYKVTEEYKPGDEGGLIWNDPDVNIDWPNRDPIVNERDQEFMSLKNIIDNNLLPDAAY